MNKIQRTPRPPDNNVWNKSHIMLPLKTELLLWHGAPFVCGFLVFFILKKLISGSPFSLE
jgi:hypothetical protein